MHIEQLWQEFLTMVQQEVGSRVVETWFKALSLEQWDPQTQTIYISAPNSFVKDWVFAHYKTMCQTHLGRLFHVENPTVQFVDTPQDITPVTSPSKTLAHVPVFSPMKPSSKEGLVKKKRIGKINSHYLFDTFVVGPNNSLAYAAAHAVTEKPGLVYNPLFIYGESGLGKTHLMHAIGNKIKAQNSHATILYQTADRFVNEFIHAIRFDKIMQFKDKYQQIDVLLVDDIQFISNKEQTQEAFFHIFNALYDARKQLIFSSDTFPQHMQGIAERLRSRLSWGLVTDIHAPSLETKVAILKKKISAQHMLVPDDVIYYIASSITSNIRDLEGAMIRILAFASLTERHIDMALAEKVLVRPQAPAQKSITLARVVANISKHYACTLDDLRSKSRNKEVTRARQVAMYCMKTLTDKSLREIGAYLGGRDHSTVKHAIEKVAELLKTDPVGSEIHRLKQEIMKV